MSADFLDTEPRRMRARSVVGARLPRAPILALLLFASLLLARSVLHTLPHAPLTAAIPWSTAVLATDGQLLRLTTAADQQYRLPVALDEVSPQLVEAVKLYEDRWFDWHWGIDPFALARSAWATATGGRRQGGSTITMQVARRVYRIDSRSLRGKVTQIAAALWLDARYSKREILNAYLNLAPYGGNVEGVGAASLIHFRKQADRLVLPEALSLAVIPQNPRQRAIGRSAWRDGGTTPGPASAQDDDPDDARGEPLNAARARLWRVWLARHPDDASHAGEMRLALGARRRGGLPFEAPHAVELLLHRPMGVSIDAPEHAQHDAQRYAQFNAHESAAHAPATAHVIRSSIDLPRQKLIERVTADYLKSRADSGIVNASVLLLDAATMRVEALLGSADFAESTIGGQVDGTRARRSPGSTLKPFIYALALDQGVLHPATVLRDLPTSFGPFSPENFDGRFVGPISAEDALIRSRNIPAVQVAAKLGKPDLYDLLKSAGVDKLAAREHYGLALVLGGGEVTMEELAGLYAMLANGGRWQPPVYADQPQSRAQQGAAAIGRDRQAAIAGRPMERTLLSEEAAFITLAMLKKNPRPDTLSPARPAVAWKTGTSWGFRDAWTAGVVGRQVLVVWLGNFDGASNPALIGLDAAAPLFFRIVDALRAEGLARPEVPRPLPPDVRRLTVCAASGELPDAGCPRTVDTWFIAGKSPIRKSTLHRAAWVDRRDGRIVCAPNAHTERKLFEVWPSDLRQVMRQSGLPLADAAEIARCDASEGGASDGGAPRIVTPLRGVTHSLRASRAEPLLLRAEADGDARTLFWFVDDALIGRAKPGETLEWRVPIRDIAEARQAQRYTVRVVDDAGRADSRELDVEWLP
jgi:penicillin-binding protein 1C